VRERTQEIGVLKAIGASTGQVVRQFAVEALSLSGMAAAAGALLLLVAGGRIAQAFDLTPASGSAAGPTGASSSPAAGQHLLVTLTPQSLLVVLGVGLLLAVVASVIPTWVVARIKPAQVLRMA
jgi:ABC-type antimicrobial peptide transport system permease subunit